MLKVMTGLLMGMCLIALPAAYADTGVSEDTGGVEDTGTADDDTGSIGEDTGSTSDTGSSETASGSTASSGPTYGAADLAGESGSCATVSAVPAGWMLGCILLVLVRRRLT